MAIPYTWSASPFSESHESAVESTSPAGLNVGRFGFQEIVHRVAVHRLAAAGSPRLPIEIDQSGLCRILIARAPLKQYRPGDKRQFVIFL